MQDGNGSDSGYLVPGTPAPFPHLKNLNKAVGFKSLWMAVRPTQGGYGRTVVGQYGNGAIRQFGSTAVGH